MAMNNLKEPFRTEAEKAHARKADEDAKRLVDVLRPLHRPEAERYVKKNPPSVATIVGMAFYAKRLAAQKPRPDPLTEILTEIIRRRPNASTNDVLDALRSRANTGGPIAAVDGEGTVDWTNKKGEDQETKRTDIAKRISRIRKSLKAPSSR
jgi:hypothetical protein